MLNDTPVSEAKVRRLALKVGLRLVKLRGFVNNYYGRPYILEDAETSAPKYGYYGSGQHLTLEDAAKIVSA